MPADMGIQPAVAFVQCLISVLFLLVIVRVWWRGRE